MARTSLELHYQILLTIVLALSSSSEISDVGKDSKLENEQHQGPDNHVKRFPVTTSLTKQNTTSITY